MLRIFALFLSMLLATHAWADPNDASHKDIEIKRTADDVKVPSPKRYGTPSDSARWRDANGNLRQLYPPDVRLYRKQLALKAYAHYSDAAKMSYRLCVNPWPPAIEAIEILKGEIEVEISLVKELIAKYEAERQEAQRKKFKETDRELGIWLVGLKDTLKEWETDFNWVKSILDLAKGGNRRWKKPEHCDKDKKKDIKLGGDPKPVEDDDDGAGYFNPDEFKLRLKYGFGGGMTKIDPPTFDLEPKDEKGDADKEGGNDEGGWSIDPDYLKNKRFYDGGMTEIDPPKFLKLSVKTKCKPCQIYADDYNHIVDQYNEVQLIIGNLKYRLKEFRKKMEAERQKNKGTKGKGGLDAAGRALKEVMRNNEIEKKYEKEIDKFQKLLDELTKQLDEAAQRLAECEKQCKPEERTSGFKVGGGVTEFDPFALPFDWKGPYTTNCPERCQKITDTLNELPEKVRKTMLEIRKLGFDNKVRDLRKHHLQLEDHKGKIAQNERKLKKLRKELQRFKDYFKELLKAKKDCEDKYCKPKPKKEKKIGYLPGYEDKSQNVAVAVGNVEVEDDFEIEIELEDARSTSGVNAFDAKGIEYLQDDNNDMLASTNIKPAAPIASATQTIKDTSISVVNEPVVVNTEPEVEIIQEDPSGLIDKPITAFNPFFNTPGEALIHIMFGSKCPDHVGSPQVQTTDNRPVKAEVVSNHTVLNTQVQNNNSPSPKVDVKFNCNVPGTGDYNETVRVKVTDIESGQSKELNYNASVKVKK